MDGIINVEISQRQPILRVINQFDQDFYIDQHGLKIPLSSNFTARVLVANGYIDELFANRVDTLHTSLAADLFKTADYIRKDSLWDAQIAQIYVNPDHEIELIPRVGNNRILLGNADSLDNKFHNLLVFYKKAIPQVGWEAYKTINIKYANQVVGVKNEKPKTDSLKSKSAGQDTSKAIKDTSQTKN
jgi:cell division protein FtsQ